MKKKIKYNDYGFDDQISMFNHIWSSRLHRSVVSNKDLDLVPDFLWVNCFSHVLPKGAYTKYKLNPDNILLITPEEHFLLDQGTIEQREEYEKANNCSFKPYYEKKEQLYKEYMQL
jgi:hypothetical protein